MPRPARFAGCVRVPIALLVKPVCRIAPFGLSVHVERPNLHLEHRAIRVVYAGVQSPVTILLRSGNVVLEAADFRRENTVHNAKGGVAISFSRHNNSKSKQIMDFGEVQTLALQSCPHPGGKFQAVQRPNTRNPPVRQMAEVDYVRGTLGLIVPVWGADGPEGPNARDTLRGQQPFVMKRRSYPLAQRLHCVPLT